jgi:hypothetical protein
LGLYQRNTAASIAVPKPCSKRKKEKSSRSAPIATASAIEYEADDADATLMIPTKNSQYQVLHHLPH